MMSVRLKYRCKICGDVFAGEVISDSDNPGMGVLCLIGEYVQSFKGARPELHSCRSQVGNIGIGDLIGVCTVNDLSQPENSERTGDNGDIG